MAVFFNRVGIALGAQRLYALFDRYVSFSDRAYYALRTYWLRTEMDAGLPSRELDGFLQSLLHLLPICSPLDHCRQPVSRHRTSFRVKGETVKQELYDGEIQVRTRISKATYAALFLAPLPGAATRLFGKVIAKPTDNPNIFVMSYDQEWITLVSGTVLHHSNGPLGGKHRLRGL